jgi:hypothetical protein
MLHFEHLKRLITTNWRTTKDTLSVAHRMLHTKTTEYSNKAITAVSKNCSQKLDRKQNTALHTTTSTPVYHEICHQHTHQYWAKVVLYFQEQNKQLHNIYWPIYTTRTGRLKIQVSSVHHHWQNCTLPHIVLCVWDATKAPCLSPESPHNQDYNPGGQASRSCTSNHPSTGYTHCHNGYTPITAG